MSMLIHNYPSIPTPAIPPYPMFFPPPFALAFHLSNTNAAYLQRQVKCRQDGYRNPHTGSKVQRNNNVVMGLDPTRITGSESSYLLPFLVNSFSVKVRPRNTPVASGKIPITIAKNDTTKIKPPRFSPPFINPTPIGPMSLIQFRSNNINIRK